MGEIVRICKEDMPKELREIQGGPKELFCMGNIDLLRRPKVAIVGSRRATEYGKWVGRKLGETLAENQIVVVSGLAVGIDTAAHEGAIEVYNREKNKAEGARQRAAANTIAVLGCGHDYVYPKANLHIRKIIEEKGLVISEYPPETRPTTFTFPMRNRIISGLSRATIVVEGGINSGAMITAEMAATQGKEVYAVPGNINRASSIGTNKLIKDGAMPIVFLDDIIYDLGLVPAEKEEDLKLGIEEKALYKLVSLNGEIDINQVHKNLNISPAIANGLITVLELKGLLFTAMGKVFVAKK